MWKSVISTTFSSSRILSLSTAAAMVTPGPPDNAASMSPAEARAIFRCNKYYGNTNEFCIGYNQANLAIVPQDMADDFKEFCRRSPAAFPVLYSSKPGEVAAPPLAKGTDIRTDVPRYAIHSNGKRVSDMLDLLGFSWDGYVSFYLGCSFSFNKEFVKLGIKSAVDRQGKNVPMYHSNVQCPAVGQWPSCSMVVSMRGIPKALLEQVAVASAGYPMFHGAPVHIGNPALLGITNWSNIDYGNVMELQDDEVCVFWGCGVTGQTAIASAKPPLAFTHYPGCMFITDTPAAPVHLQPEETPELVAISPARAPYYASLLSTTAHLLLARVEATVLDDPGHCQVRKLRVEGDFIKAVLSLSHARCVGLTTGFPCLVKHDQKEETDGLPGVLALARALQVLGKKIVLISDTRNQSLFESCVDHLVTTGELSTGIEVIPYHQLIEQGRDNEFDCLVSSERCGRAADGTYRSFRAVDLSEHLDPVDDLFLKAQSNPDITTIGIGDRGNELGLGKIADKVKAVVENGSTIGCVTPADYVVMAGVSNWGAYGLVAGLQLVSSCPVHRRYRQKGVDIDVPLEQVRATPLLPTDAQARSLLLHLNKQGVRDGVLDALQPSVDGLPLGDHLNKLHQLRALVNELK